MKYKFIAFVAVFLSVTFGFSQKTVEASKIMKDIKKGVSISIENATIVGVLDFTFMEEAIEKHPKKKKSWWGNNGDNTIKKVIEIRISFVNCTFKDHILAYIPDENSGYTYIANFEDEVIFKSCTFERKAMFKYSCFEENTDFSNTVFEDDNTFKYAKFDKEINFTKAIFKESATFKYAKFSRKVSFANTLFKDTATFKYTKFNNGVSFVNAIFEEDLNIKYVKVSGDFEISNMKVAYEIDAKYAKINGNSFNKTLVSKN